MTIWPRRLRTRLMLAMSVFALAVTALYSLYALAFAYTVEDKFIERTLADEAQMLRLQAQRGEALRPRLARLYAEFHELPADVRRTLEVESQRTEIVGDAGRHYHLMQIDLPDRRYWLVAEVSNQLIFRGMRGTVAEILVWSMLAALLMAIAIGYVIASATTGRVERLARRLDSLQPEALDRSSIEAEAADEVAVLEHGVAQMLARISRFVEREQTFARDVSHELRTPLCVILSASEQLAHSRAPEDRQRAESILAAAQQMSRTLASLLTLARSDDATAATPTRLLPAIERAILEQAALLDQTRASIQLDIDRDVQIGLREELLDVVLRNLIANAIAHSAQGQIRMFVSDGRFYISNPSEHAVDAEHFVAFNKGERSAGVGLGLNILKRLDQRFGLGLAFVYEHESQRVVASVPVLPPATGRSST